MRSLLDRLRNPSHTGERRCWPCTVTNTVLLILACAGLAQRRSRALAAALGLGGGITIALRGYLVPYTPRFAPRVSSWLLGNVFHADSRMSNDANRDSPAISDATEPREAPDSSESLAGNSDTETGEEVLVALLERGVMTTDDERVYLDDDFRTAWRSSMRDLRERDDRGLADALGSAAPEGIVADVVQQGGGRFGDSRRWFVVSDGSDDPARERWLTRPVTIAEAAAVRTLADWNDGTDTDDLNATRRAQAAGPLRTFLESCPVCDGRVEETTVVECCGGPAGTRADAPDEVLACADCDVRLYTFQ